MKRDDAAELRAILAELRELRAEVAELRAERRPVGRADAGLVRAIATAFPGSYVFSARELMEHAQLPTAAPLADALAASGSPSARHLGKTLRRIEGRDFDGLRVVRVGDDRDGAVWQLRVCEFQTRTLTSPIAPRRARGR